MLTVYWVIIFTGCWKYNQKNTSEKKSGSDPLEVFTQALTNVRPLVEVKSRRVGGANYQVPVEVRSVRRNALAMRWLRDAARKRSEKSMDARLAGELAEAAEGRGGAVKNVNKTMTGFMPSMSVFARPGTTPYGK